MTAPAGVIHEHPAALPLETTSPTTAQRILHRSEDGKTLAGVFEESGKATFSYDYMEFLVVVAGRADCRVEGGESFALETGDCAVLPAGATVHFVFSDDFRDACCMVGTAPIPY